MSEYNWYVVQTNIKCEEKATGNLSDAGITVYYPCYRKEIVHHRTKKIVTKTYPLFRGYLFVSMPAVGADWFTLRRCEGVESILGVEGRPIPVPAKSVEQFIAAQEDLQFDQTDKARKHRGEIKKTRKEQIRSTFTPGKLVTINRGTFQGFSGHVAPLKGGEEVKWNDKVEVMISLLNGLVPVQFPVDDLNVVGIDYESAA